LLERDYVRWFATEVHVGLGKALRPAGVLGEPLNAGDARAAAEVVLREFQLDLERLKSPVEFQLARSIMRKRFWALTALIRTRHRVAGTNGPGDGGVEGHKDAKQVLLEVTGGSPLTICMGDRYRIRHGERDGVDTAAGYLRFAVNGCRSIFEEDPRTSGEMWAGLCRACRNKARRNQGRDLRKKVNAAVLTEDSRRVRAGWSSTAETFCDIPHI
jgi:hypothetical protein